MFSMFVLGHKKEEWEVKWPCLLQEEPLTVALLWRLLSEEIKLCRLPCVPKTPHSVVNIDATWYWSTCCNWLFKRSPVTIDYIISQNWKDTFRRWRISVFLNEKENIGLGLCREAWRDLPLCLHPKAQTMRHFFWPKRREAAEILEYTGQPLTSGCC